MLTKIGRQVAVVLAALKTSSILINWGRQIIPVTKSISCVTALLARGVTSFITCEPAVAETPLDFTSDVHFHLCNSFQEWLILGPLDLSFPSLEPGMCFRFRIDGSIFVSVFTLFKCRLPCGQTLRATPWANEPRLGSWLDSDSWVRPMGKVQQRFLYTITCN